MSIKTRIKDALIRYDRDLLLDICLDEKRAPSALNRLLFDEDKLIQWRAVDALGWCAVVDPFPLEKVVARLIYTLNDDSGSIGWMAPQALGELCAVDPDLVEDFFPIVISSIETPAFTSGVIWAISRVAPVRPDLVEHADQIIEPFLYSPAPDQRGLTCWALGRLDSLRHRQTIEKFIDDSGSFAFYRSGRLLDKTVGEMAADALRSA